MNVRAATGRERHRLYMAMLSRRVLEPTNPRTIAEDLTGREAAFLRGFFWTGVWTEEARRAYYF